MTKISVFVCGLAAAAISSVLAVPTNAQSPELRATHAARRLARFAAPGTGRTPAPAVSPLPILPFDAKLAPADPDGIDLFSRSSASAWPSAEQRW
jgi:hypothetical protein